MTSPAPKSEPLRILYWRSEILRVVYWTGSPVASLPGMIRGDQHTRIVDKAAGTKAFEDAIDWALAGSGQTAA